MNELLGLPKTLGRYEIVSLLGKGGMGRVVRGHDPVLRRDIALKLIEPAAIDPDSLDELRFMFHREARATASLRHPNIVEVLDYSGPNAELLYLACELIEGPTLYEHCAEHGAIGPHLALAIGYEVLSALVHAHAQGIVHRDIKPENIFWTPSGRIVVSDFGIAKAFDDKLGQTVQFGSTNLYGSPSYIAPEQLLGSVTHQSDIYAAGAILFELCTGQQAFGGDDIESILGKVERGERMSFPQSVGLPRSLRQFIDLLMTPDPALRITGPVALVQVRALLDEMGVSDPRLALKDFGRESDIITAPMLAATKPHQRDVETVLLDVPPTEWLRTKQKVTSPNKIKWIFGLAVVAIGASTAGLAAWLHNPTQAATVVVPVRIRVESSAQLTVDQGETQLVQNETTLWLEPGRRHLSLKQEGVTLERDIWVVEGSAPVFDF